MIAQLKRTDRVRCAIIILILLVKIAKGSRIVLYAYYYHVLAAVA